MLNNRHELKALLTHQQTPLNNSFQNGKLLQKKTDIKKVYFCHRKNKKDSMIRWIRFSHFNLHKIHILHQNEKRGNKK